jgi:predicted dehydrogenase
LAAVAGGIFHDCAVHDIDIMCWVIGEYPSRVTAHVHAHTPEIAAIGDYDTVAVVLSFPSGTLGMIDLSRNSTYGYDQRLEVGPCFTIVDTNFVLMDNRWTVKISSTPQSSQHLGVHFNIISRYVMASFNGTSS